METIIISVGTVAAVLAAVFAMSNWNRTRRRGECAVGPWLVLLALVVPLVACSSECERAAAKTCKAAQDVADFDFDTFDACVRNEVSRCRGRR